MVISKYHAVLSVVFVMALNGELARLLMWERPLSNQEFEKTLSCMKTTYMLSPEDNLN